jgi:DNA-binding transcriptional ArsR family regulator
MATLDKMVREILEKYEIDPREATWNCHGTWVILHRYLERIADKAGITFDKPEFVHTDAKGKEAVMLVTGHMDDKSAWSIGEAMPYNNKNTYPFAMSEKRGKDRVILKLAGLSGHVYSEEEADDFKGRPSSPPPPVQEVQQQQVAAPVAPAPPAPQVVGPQAPAPPPPSSSYLSMEDKEDMIVEALRNSSIPMGNSDLRKATGLTQSQFSNAAKSLVQKGAILLEGERRGALYRMVNGGGAPLPGPVEAPEEQGKTLMEVFAEEESAVQRMVDDFNGEVVSVRPAPPTIDAGEDEVEEFKRACERVIKNGFTFVTISEIVRKHTGCATAEQVVKENKITNPLIEALQNFEG